MNWTDKDMHADADLVIVVTVSLIANARAKL